MKSRLLPLPKAVLALATAVTAATPTLASEPGPGGRAMDVLTTVPGSVPDLSVDASGDLLFCTQEGDVGTIDSSGTITILATAATGPFPNVLRAVATAPGGDVVVLDTGGNVYRLVGGTTPADLVYDDLYLIQETTDLLVDATGNYVIASRTPTSGVRALNWVSPDGQKWSYFLIKHSPIQLAHDPLTGDLLLTEDDGDGALRLIDAVDKSRPTTALDTTTDPGFSAVQDDGDMAVEADGDVLYIAGGRVYRYDRGTGNSTQIASGYLQLRGIAIAASSGNVPSASGWSAYLAEGSSPTTIREIGNVGAPAGTLATGLGNVPGRGIEKKFFAQNGIKVYELAVDADGHLLVGGDLWNNNYSVRRIDIPSFSVSTVAHQVDGLSGRVEGIATSRDGTIYALTTPGQVHRIQESPLSVTTLFDNMSGEMTTGKDMILGHDDLLYLADLNFWGSGDIFELDQTGDMTLLTTTRETRALAADPFTAGLYVTEWVDTGFCGEITAFDFDDETLTLVPGLIGMNYTNAATWGDGDTVVDVEGNIYTVSEDDWSVRKYSPGNDRFVRILSSYLNHPSGIAIARSGSMLSTTGWSLYVAEFDYLWEFPSVPPPAPTIIDKDAAPVGNLVGYLNPEVGEARAMVPDPAGGGFLISTSLGSVERINLANGAATTVAGAAQGLSGDLVALATTAAGNILAAANDGVIYELDPNAGYNAALFYDNGGGELSDVRGITLDGSGRVIVVDRPASSTGSRVYRIEGGALELLTHTNRGLRAAIDPLTADIFVTQQGAPTDSGGEVLRVDQISSPVRHGHYGGDVYYTFQTGDYDGDIAFDSNGNFYVTAGDSGRVWGVNRTTGTRIVAAGNYMRPTAAVLASGRAGIAGGQGTSLFVLDSGVLYETGVPGLPAGPPPVINPGLDGPPDVQITGNVQLGGATPVTVRNAAEAGKLYWILSSIFGKEPGIPLSALGDGSDPRTIANNYDGFLWTSVSDPSLLPGFLAMLTPGGESVPGTAFLVPNDITILDLDLFCDVTWVVIDSMAQNKLAHVGGTAHLFLGN